MGQKINPIGFRLAVRRDWKSRWFAKGRSFSDMVIKDVTARRHVEKKYASALISKIEIGRKMEKVNFTVFSARPGVIIGKKGEGIEDLRADLRKIYGVQDVDITMQDIKQPEIDAQLVAANIASQLENRIMFRRAMRRALTNAMRLKIDGIKIMSSGRLNGIEIARTEWYREGRVPLHTLRNEIDYGFAEAHTSMGVVGVKVWISKGDQHGRQKKAKYTALATPDAEPAVEKTEGAVAGDSPVSEAPKAKESKESKPKQSKVAKVAKVDKADEADKAVTDPNPSEAPKE